MCHMRWRMRVDMLVDMLRMQTHTGVCGAKVDPPTPVPRVGPHERRGRPGADGEKRRDRVSDAFDHDADITEINCYAPLLYAVASSSTLHAQINTPRYSTYLGVYCLVARDWGCGGSASGGPDAGC